MNITKNKNLRQFAHLVALSLALVLLGSATAHGASQPTPTLVDAVRQATEPFQNAEEAMAAGYAPMLGCVSGPQEGAMGIHYMNGDLIGDGQLVAAQPEALPYEMREGELRLLGVEYLVLADAWEGAHDAPPALMGQLFNYVGSPNRYGNPPFYELHVWAWQQNPSGMFADWNPDVTCAEFTAEEATH